MSQDPHAPNRLVHEKSPYLLQHAHNPVGWYAWGEEAFAKARSEDKPIFLSIGYSTCHWCHVMERESFEDAEVAALLDANFVPVKVDREERPDVDRLYMSAMQALGVGGGWPLNVFLTPALEPFHGGTYFPPRSRGGRMGLVELLPRVAEAWSTDRAAIVASGAQVLKVLDSLAEAECEALSFEQLADEVHDWLEQSYDASEGGFGNAPKFPSTVNLDFLLRCAQRDPIARSGAQAMALRQLDAMLAGGIHDQLGGGFHRYSTDREWLVPHFEKMLYDQALIAGAYLDGFRASGDPRYAEAASGIFEYVARDLTSPDGAFLSAEDADSEGEEGCFYVWTPSEVETVLGPEDARLIAHRYGITPQGNFEHGTSILFQAHTLEGTAHALGLRPQDAAARLEAARTRLLEVRSKRVRPHLDDKVLTAWNGLMIAACAQGARVLGRPELAARAEQAADFVWSHLREGGAAPTGALLRRWRLGEAAGAGQLDDHAYYARGCLELHAATQQPRWLERALSVTNAMLARFWDDVSGGCFESPAGDPHVLVRMKDGFDGAEMAGNSVAAEVLVRLAGFTGDALLTQRAEATFAYHARRLAGNAWVMPRLLVAMDLWVHPPRHVVIVGERDAADTCALLEAYTRNAMVPDALVLVDEASRASLLQVAPFAAHLPRLDGRATAYVCVDRACRLPVTDPAALEQQLRSTAPAAGEEH
ncbi:MAG: thioredoxin domain-containing protein [Candidatus Eisenbacteria bacterium]